MTPDDFGNGHKMLATIFIVLFIVIAGMILCWEAFYAEAETPIPVRSNNYDPYAQEYLPMVTDRTGRLLVVCKKCKGEKELTCVVDSDSKLLKCNSLKTAPTKLPYLTSQCCVDPDCKEKTWCGLADIRSGDSALHDGDYIKLRMEAK